MKEDVGQLKLFTEGDQTFACNQLYKSLFIKEVAREGSSQQVLLSELLHFNHSFRSAADEWQIALV